jgi:hypothetical protein
MYSSRNPRKEDQKRLEDLDFLIKLRAATKPELEEMVKHHAHKNVPPWKRVAIYRALARAK